MMVSTCETQEKQYYMLHELKAISKGHLQEVPEHHEHL